MFTQHASHNPLLEDKKIPQNYNDTGEMDYDINYMKFMAYYGDEDHFKEISDIMNTSITQSNHNLEMVEFDIDDIYNKSYLTRIPNYFNGKINIKKIQEFINKLKKIE